MITKYITNQEIRDPKQIYSKANYGEKSVFLIKGTIFEADSSDLNIITLEAYGSITKEKIDAKDYPRNPKIWEDSTIPEVDSREERVLQVINRAKAEVLRADNISKKDKDNK